MSGLYRVFLKLTPIMLLICCICYGIYHTFQVQNQPNITYLSTQQINIGTEQHQDIRTIYTFDMVSYTQNIDQDILKRSVSHTLSIEAYEYTQTNFKRIWQDGYQLWDVVKTIANAVIITINTIILPINIAFIPIRIISGLLLTGMSIVGININNGRIIIPTLRFLTDKLAIPFIQPQATYYNYTTWTWNNSIDFNITEPIIVDAKFTETSTGYQWYGYKFEIADNTGRLLLSYKHADGTYSAVYLVFSSGSTPTYWLHPDGQTITFNGDQEISSQSYENIVKTLEKYATQIN